MNKIIIMAFTSKGYLLAEHISEKLRGGCGGDHIELHRVSNLDKLISRVFQQGNTLVFIGALGIAVRGIAPYVQSKTTDPAVVVIDEKARFVIPVLSGHIGGANEFALRIADMLDSIPVITTATDINRVFAIDTFAVQNGYVIANPERIKDVSSRLLEKRPVGLSSEYEVIGSLPENIRLTGNHDVGIRISGHMDQSPFHKTLYLLPKCFHVGIGARKNVDVDGLETFFLALLEEHTIPVERVGTISSIALKKDEPAICRLSEKYRIPYITYTAGELLPYEHLFSTSAFVKQTTGSGSICETAAYLSAKKGEMLRSKTAQNGATIAIAKEEWRVSFEDTNGGNEGR